MSIVTNWFRKAWLVLVVAGIVILLLFYVVTRFYRLESVQWLLSNVLTYIVFAIIVLYQNEIRRVLADMGKTSIWDRQRRRVGPVHRPERHHRPL